MLVLQYTNSDFEPYSFFQLNFWHAEYCQLLQVSLVDYGGSRQQDVPAWHVTAALFCFQTSVSFVTAVEEKRLCYSTL